MQLTKSLATAWAKDNIQVNAVLPGWIDTELTQRRARPGAGAATSGSWRAPRPGAGACRTTSPGIAVFLAAPASDFVTGAAIPVDGGYASEF